MLTLGDVIRAPKANVKIGDWRSGKIGASAFPLAKQRSLPASPAWSWRVVTFSALDRDFRLLIRLNSEISYYSSILALGHGEQTQIICHHEMHLSHRNWHCHFAPGNVDDTFPGVLRDYAKMRVFEAQPSQAGTVEFKLELADAINIASKRFRFNAPDETPRQAALL